MPIRGPWKNNWLNAMGLRVEIKAQGREGGTLLIKYKTLDQLDGITHRLMSKK